MYCICWKMYLEYKKQPFMCMISFSLRAFSFEFVRKTDFYAVDVDMNY